MLAAMPQDSKMIFGEYSPVWKVILHHVEILRFTRKTLNHLKDDYNKIMYSSSSDIGNTKPIKMDIETDLQFPQ